MGMPGYVGEEEEKEGAWVHIPRIRVPLVARWAWCVNALEAAPGVKAHSVRTTAYALVQTFVHIWRERWPVQGRRRIKYGLGREDGGSGEEGQGRGGG